MRVTTRRELEFPKDSRLWVEQGSFTNNHPRGGFVSALCLGEMAWRCLRLPARARCLAPRFVRRSSLLVRSWCPAAARAVARAVNNKVADTKNSWWVGSLIGMQASLFTWVTVIFYFLILLPSVIFWVLKCRRKQGLKCPAASPSQCCFFPPILAARRRCCRIPPGTSGTHLDLAHHLFVWIFC